MASKQFNENQKNTIGNQVTFPRLGTFHALQMPKISKINLKDFHISLMYIDIPEIYAYNNLLFFT